MKTIDKLLGIKMKFLIADETETLVGKEVLVECPNFELNWTDMFLEEFVDKIMNGEKFELKGLTISCPEAATISVKE